MEDRAVSSVVGTVLMVAIAVAVAAALLVFVIGISSSNQSTPAFPSFSQDRADGKLIVIHAGGEIRWSDLDITPDTVSINDADNDGILDAGEYIYNCNGKIVSIVYTPSNILLGRWDFT